MDPQRGWIAETTSSIIEFRSPLTWMRTWKEDGDYSLIVPYTGSRREEAISRFYELENVLRSTEQRDLDRRIQNNRDFNEGLEILAGVATAAAIANGTPERAPRPVTSGTVRTPQPNLTTASSPAVRIQDDRPEPNPAGTFYNPVQGCTEVDRAEGSSSFSYITNSCGEEIRVRFYDAQSYTRGGMVSLDPGERQAIGKLVGGIRWASCPSPSTPRNGADQVSTWTGGQYVCR